MSLSNMLISIAILTLSNIALAQQVPEMSGEILNELASRYRNNPPEKSTASAYFAGYIAGFASAAISARIICLKHGVTSKDFATVIATQPDLSPIAPTDKADAYILKTFQNKFPCTK